MFCKQRPQVHLTDGRALWPADRLFLKLKKKNTTAFS